VLLLLWHLRGPRRCWQRVLRVLLPWREEQRLLLLLRLLPMSAQPLV
jgi:hypothetical protein